MWGLNVPALGKGVCDEFLLSIICSSDRAAGRIYSCGSWRQQRASGISYGGIPFFWSEGGSRACAHSNQKQWSFISSQADDRQSGAGKCKKERSVVWSSHCSGSDDCIGMSDFRGGKAYAFYRRTGTGWQCAGSTGCSADRSGGKKGGSETLHCTRSKWGGRRTCKRNRDHWGKAS